jgi:hypothetical protein
MDFVGVEATSACEFFQPRQASRNCGLQVLADA